MFSSLLEPPQIIRHLIAASDSISGAFRVNVRAYNNALAMCSVKTD